MARGNPRFWSAVLGAPFLLGGLWFFVGQTGYPNTIGAPFAFFGVFIAAIGVYVHYTRPRAQPELQDDEDLIDTRHPTQRVALVKIVSSIPLFVLTVQLFFFTDYPYVYPTLAFLGGLYLFSGGLYTYWTNLLTTYYLTSERVIKEYRFISLLRQEVPLRKVRGVQERKSVIETIVGLGNVRVASGEGRSLEIIMKDMTQPERFASKVRDAVSSEQR